MFTYQASCQIYAWAVTAHPLPVETSTKMGSDQSAVRWRQCSDLTADWSLPISVLVWVHSFIEHDLLENNVLFGNTTPIYLINLLWKLRLGLGLDLIELHYFSIFHGE